MTDFSVDTHASILDLERRVELLESGLYGHTAPQCSVVALTRCYLEAHRALRSIDEESASIWVLQAYVWDVRAFVALGRHVADPYPFRPLLAVLDACVLSGAPGADAALAHIESVSQDVLTAQGLSLVRPRDTMNRLRLSDALRKMKIG